MKKQLLYLMGITLLFSSCAIKKLAQAYPGMYEQKPTTILIMPPINKSNNVEAKEYFHSTLSTYLNEAGYYVVPPFLSMEILKRESAYDSENFINSPLSKFSEVFGADVALFTVIDKWEKSAVLSTINVKVEYLFKSTKTGQILYSHTADISYDGSVDMKGGGIWGAIAKAALSAAKTASTNYLVVARSCNAVSFKDLPAGKYSKKHGKDGNKTASPQTITGTIDSRVY